MREVRSDEWLPRLCMGGGVTPQQVKVRWGLLRADGLTRAPGALVEVESVQAPARSQAGVWHQVLAD